MVRTCVALLLTLTLAACGSAGASKASPSKAGRSTPSATKAFDSIAVLGHSGTTGYDSDPASPGGDHLENSWVTGSAADVDSLYLRLLAAHPALKGHSFNYGVDGSDVGALADQAASMLADARPLPDLVVIQSIDNDIACDGTDDANLAPYGAALDDVLTSVEKADPGVRFFLPDQWASVATYAATVTQRPDLVRAMAGGGDCDLVTPDATVRPKAVQHLQGIVDAYFARLKEVCDRHPTCTTDDATMQALQLTPDDLTHDGNHLSVSGLAKQAAIGYAALPTEVTGG